MDVRRRVFTGFVLAVAIAGVARRANALTRGGTMAATAIGSAVFAGAGIRGSATLATFFVSSSLLSRLPARSSAMRQRRGNERDAVQVMANGGAPAFLALGMTRDPALRHPWLPAGFAGAIAAATADTWATEVGSRFGGRPRSILTMQHVRPGTSGGVSTIGTVAALAGATLIGAVASLPTRGSNDRAPAPAVIAGGIVGALVDSLLGASLQEVRFCTTCGEKTESRIHGCGMEAEKVRGAAWCTNDAVNALSVAAGAMATIAMTNWQRRERWR